MKQTMKPKNSRNLKKMLWLSVSISAVLLVGCAGSGESNTPLGSLKSSVKSAKFNDAFWGNQMDKNPKLWKEAQALCQNDKYKTHPNCVTVNTIVFFSGGSGTSIKYQDKGFGPNDVPHPK